MLYFVHATGHYHLVCAKSTKELLNKCEDMFGCIKSSISGDKIRLEGVDVYNKSTNEVEFIDNGVVELYINQINSIEELEELKVIKTGCTLEMCRDEVVE